MGATASGSEDEPIAPSGSTALVDTTSSDPDETLTTTTCGVPPGVFVSDGTVAMSVTSPGSPIDVSGWTLSGLQVTADSAHDGTFTLTVTSTANDGGEDRKSVG